MKSLAKRERVIALAERICNLMLKHADRNEAIDAYDIARVLFRKGTGEFTAQRSHPPIPFR
jgi:hypothetical protein